MTVEWLDNMPRVIAGRVTQQHIDAGVRGAWLCPIALFVRENLGEEWEPVVYSGSIAIHGPDVGMNVLEATLPFDAAVFINRFDRGWHVVPFDLRIELKMVDPYANH